MTTMAVFFSCMIGCWLCGILVGYCIRDEIGHMYKSRRRRSSPSRRKV